MQSTPPNAVEQPVRIPDPAAAMPDRPGVAERVARELRSAVLENSLSFPHGQLPSHRELCRQHRVSINTLRKALDILEADGVIYRVERGGTFLRPRSGEPSSPARPTGLKCINFLEEFPPMWQILKTDYLAGYTEALDAYDIKTRFVPCPADTVKYESLLSDRLTVGEQGCVLVNIAPEGLMRWLGARGIPFVVQFFTCYDRAELPEHHSIYVNKAGAADEATRHLLGHGHRRIGFIGPTAPDYRRLVGLYEGYLAALTCAGLAPVEENVLDLNTNETDAIVETVRRYLDRPTRPTGVVTGNDGIAFAVTRAAKALGLRVPEDLSVIGYNDLPEAARSEPPLTTVYGPRRLLARTAVEMVIAAAEGRCEGFKTRVLNGHLVIRRSAAPPPGRPGAL